jgi:hypothetical protein
MNTPTLQAFAQGLALLYTAPMAFAFFCAWWAQQHGRNAWGWFFFGLLLMPVAGLWLLAVNGDLRDAIRTTRKADAVPRHDLRSTRKDVP